MINLKSIMVLAQGDYANETDHALFEAIKGQRWEDLAVMLEKEVHFSLVGRPDGYGNYPLHTAIGFRAPEPILLRLIDLCPHAAREHGTDEWLPLHVAAMWGPSPAVTERLIRLHPEGLDDVGQGGLKGRTPRHFCARHPYNRALLERSTNEWIELISSSKNGVK